ncbi:RNAse Z [Alicyclobacillus sacchari]|uniref:Ribonuclease Z n=1 Tax=Alicyclobacillus sacchari TaxID=392010 RepID=A0A4R8LMI0_9BACL|nr:ribonuclease Z [Alicyclobacillus sacchari]TDY44577.1 RNAse Z [Alicyclobacillus sacchari]GMA57928.1 ribonuclease BN [Alicyclobacillus sacchari]
MELYFLGTGAGLPSTRRNVTSIALRLSRGTSRVWLFDCGEGTQQQMLTAPFGPAKVDRIFITHLHGDHIFGLPGMLGSRSFQAGSGPLSILGPLGLRTFLKTAVETGGSHILYPWEVTEISDAVRDVVIDGDYRVSYRRLRHGIPSYGYRVEERPFPGALRKDLLEAAGLPPGPLYKKIKSGHDVTLPDGRTLVAADYVDPPEPGRIIAILGDTRPCDEAVELARDADIIVHEATYTAADADLAARHHHSTAAEAAAVARAAGARKLVLTHVSSRYDHDGEEQLLADAKRIFPNTILAHDHLSVLVERVMSKRC